MEKQVEAGCVTESALGGKLRFTRQRKKTLGVVREIINGAIRYKVRGLYVAGRRVRKFFPTEKEARTFIEAQNIRTGNIGALASRMDSQLANDAAECAMLLRPHGARLLDAVREWVACRDIMQHFPDVPLTEAAKTHALRLKERTQSWTVEEGAKHWLDSLERQARSARYYGDARNRLARFRSLYSRTSMADITPDHVQKWLRSMGKLSPQSQKNYLTVASSMFAHAVKHHKAPRNPVQEIERPDVVREEAGILTPAELRRLLHHLPADTVPFVVLSAFAGLRPAEVQRLEWKDINFANNIVSVQASKSKIKRRRTVPLSPNLAAWLRPLAKDEGKVVALADLTIRQKRLKPAREKAKLTRWPHDCLRHSAATYLLQREGDAARVALWLGHTQEVLHEHCKGLLTNPEHAAEWFAIVPPESAERTNVIPMTAA